MQMFVLSHKIFLFKLILLSPIHLNFLFIIQDTWEEVDPDELSYEVSWLGLSVPMMLLLNFIPYSMIHLSQELLALGEVVGTESRGLSADTIASLPSINYKTGSSQNGSNDS